MSLPQGIAFRSTAAYVTDGANDFVGRDFNVAPYPVTSTQGNTVGWEDDLNCYNLNSGIDVRLAGIALDDRPGTGKRYRIDLPSTGNYNVRIAAGFWGYSSAVDVSLLDTTTVLAVLSSGSTSGGTKFKDANNTEFSNVTWSAGNVAKAATFSTTICRFKLTTDNSAIAYAYVEAAAASGPTYPQTERGIRGLTRGLAQAA